MAKFSALLDSVEHAKLNFSRADARVRRRHVSTPPGSSQGWAGQTRDQTMAPAVRVRIETEKKAPLVTSPYGGLVERDNRQRSYR